MKYIPNWHKETFEYAAQKKREWLKTHPPRPFQQRMEMAREFSEYVGAPIEDWMLHPRWYEGVGCDACVHDPNAPCWGSTNCHGYYRGCGCCECAAQWYADGVAQEFEEQLRQRKYAER